MRTVSPGLSAPHSELIQRASTRRSSFVSPRSVRVSIFIFPTTRSGPAVLNSASPVDLPSLQTKLSLTRCADRSTTVRLQLESLPPDANASQRSIISGVTHWRTLLTVGLPPCGDIER